MAKYSNTSEFTLGMSPQPEPDGETDKGPPSDEDEEGVDSIPTPQFVIDNANSDSESENEDGDGYYGYQMLPQEPEDISGDTVGTSVADNLSQSSQSSTSSTEAGAEGQNTADCDKDKSEHLNKLDHCVLHQVTGGQATGYMRLPDLPKPESKELLWNKQRTSTLQMEPGQAEKVKTAMSNILLPTPNIPDWAKNISEEDWNNKLVSLRKSNTS